LFGELDCLAFGEAVSAILTVKVVVHVTLMFVPVPFSLGQVRGVVAVKANDPTISPGRGVGDPSVYVEVVKV
jgi:hypothetical protein